MTDVLIVYTVFNSLKIITLQARATVRSTLEQFLSLYVFICLRLCSAEGWLTASVLAAGPAVDAASSSYVYFCLLALGVPNAWKNTVNTTTLHCRNFLAD
jgi:hypothetical protein